MPIITPKPPTPSPFEVKKQELEQFLVSAWRAGDDPTEIENELDRQGWLSLKEVNLVEWEWSVNAKQWLVLDLDGDGADEWLLTVFFPYTNDPLPFGHVGELLIINGEGVVYRLSEYQSDFQGPVTIAYPDLTADGLPDVILKSYLPGAHTFSYVYYILSAHYGEIDSIVRLGNELDRLSLPFRDPLQFVEDSPPKSWTGTSIGTGSDEKIIDMTDDGLPDLVLRGGLYGSAGAGIQRAYNEVWSWDGSYVALADVWWNETPYRIHTLFDGNYAFALGNYEKAIEKYKKVIYDDTLDNYAYTCSDEESYEANQQYAAFRLALSYLELKNSENGLFWHNWLNAEFPESLLAQASNLLLETWQESNDLAQSCDAVTRFLENSTWDSWDTPWPLVETGYANPRLSSDTVCPIKE